MMMVVQVIKSAIRLGFVAVAHMQKWLNSDFVFLKSIVRLVTTHIFRFLYIICFMAVSRI